MIIDTGVLGYLRSRVGKRDVGIVQILGRDHDGDILGLKDRVLDRYHMYYKALS